jgi:hypothetical protein
MLRAEPESKGVVAEIEERRNALERLAQSGYPIADTAAALLEIAEEHDE